MRRESLLALCLLLGACARPVAPPPLLGELAWQHIDLLADASEPVMALHVAQGDSVEAGTLIAELDSRRARARLAQAQAEVDRAAAAREEALNGARAETLSSARAELASLRATREEAQREQTRVHDLVARGLAAQSERDRVDATAQRARAAYAAGEARLEELLRGTRREQLAQAEFALAAATAQRDRAELDVQALSLRAPRAGRIDALPFEVGDRPAQGAAVATLLVGEAPYARVYVPATQRAGLAPGQAFELQIIGLDTPVPGRLTEIASEPAFTPYFALNGEDASQLVYRAEIALDGDGAAAWAAGLPVQATRRDAR